MRIHGRHDSATCTRVPRLPGSIALPSGAELHRAIQGPRDCAAGEGSLIVNNCETMKQMVLAGIGVARLGLFHVAAEIAEGSCLCSKTAIQVTSN